MAEMLRTPLEQVALLIKLLKLGSVGDFLMRAVEPPPMDSVIEAQVLLRGTLASMQHQEKDAVTEMNAFDANQELTPLGRILARLPIEPRMGKTLVLAAALG